MLHTLAVFVVASTVVTLLGVPSWLQRGRRRPAAGCGIAEFAAGWRITAENVWGTADALSLYGDHLWPDLVLLRKPVQMENRVLGAGMESVYGLSSRSGCMTVVGGPQALSSWGGVRKSERAECVPSPAAPYNHWSLDTP